MEAVMRFVFLLNIRLILIEISWAVRLPRDRICAEGRIPHDHVRALIHLGSTMQSRATYHATKHPRTSEDQGQAKAVTPRPWVITNLAANARQTVLPTHRPEVVNVPKRKIALR